MKMLLLLTVIALASCSGNLWYSARSVDDSDSTITMTFELPGPIELPWTLEAGQMAVCRQDIWYLYEDGLLIDTYTGK